MESASDMGKPTHQISWGREKRRTPKTFEGGRLKRG